MRPLFIKISGELSEQKETAAGSFLLLRHKNIDSTSEVKYNCSWLVIANPCAFLIFYDMKGPVWFPGRPGHNKNKKADL